MPVEDDELKKNLKEIWGDSLDKLTPKQRQLVEYILNNQNVELESASYLDLVNVSLGTGNTA